MVIPVSYSTDNQLTRNCPTETPKLENVRKIFYQRTYQARFFWQKGILNFYLKLQTFYSNELFGKDKIFDPINGLRALLHTIFSR